MRMFTLAFICILSFPALAQEKIYAITVTQSQLVMIGNALGELPYNKVAGLIGLLSAQVEEQNRPPKQPEPETKQPDANK